MVKWLALVFVLGIAVALLKRLKPRVSAGQSWPVRAVPVLSRPEQTLYFRLLQALPDYVVLAQVQVARMLKITSSRNVNAIRNRFDRKSADFVVCNKDFSVLAVIELDDSSHQRADRVKADAVKDAVLQAAGLRMIRWHVKELPSIEHIREVILPAALPPVP